MEKRKSNNGYKVLEVKNIMFLRKGQLFYPGDRFKIKKEFLKKDPFFSFLYRVGAFREIKKISQ